MIKVKIIVHLLREFNPHLTINIKNNYSNPWHCITNLQGF